MTPITMLTSYPAAQFYANQIEFYYRTMKSPNFQFRLFYWFFLIQVISTIIRMLLLAYLGPVYAQLDSHISFVFSGMEKHPMFLLTSVVFNLSPTLHHILIFNQSDPQNLELLHDLVVKNWREFVVQNPKFIKGHLNWRSPFKEMRLFAVELKHIWIGHSLKIANHQNQLKSMPNLAPQIRLRLIVLLSGFHLMQIAEYIFTFNLGILLIYANLEFHNQNLIQIFWLNLDFALIFASFQIGMSVSFALVFTLVALGYAVCGQLNLLKIFLGQEIHNKSSRTAFPIILEFYLREHSHIQIAISRWNEKLVSLAIAIFISTHSCFNIYQINFLLLNFTALHTQILTALCFTILLQFYYGLNCALMLTRFSGSIHAPRKLLPKVQLLLRGSELVRAKLKLERHFELQLNSERKFGISAAPISGTITDRSVMEFALFYGAQNLLVNSFIRSHL